MTKTWKTLTKWMLLIVEAWADGRAAWAYENGLSVAVKTWEAGFREGGEEGALARIINLARSHGLELRGASPSGGHF